MAVRVFLEPTAVALLLELAGLEAHASSPLATIAAAKPCALDGPGGARLRERGLIVGDDPPRINAAFAGVLETAARPHEALGLQVSGPQAPGFTLCRRGDFWAECTVGPLGVVKIEYPLNRAAMVIAAVRALSSDRDEAPPVGFRFRGPGADLSVLHALVAAGRDGVAAGDLDATVRAYLDAQPGVVLAATIADPGGLRTLIEQPTAATDASYRLATQGLVAVAAGRVTASRSARAILQHRADAGFVVSRTVFDGDEATAVAVQAWRAGDHNLVVRSVRLDTGAAGLDARDIGRADLRALIAGVFADEATLTRAVAAAE